MKREGADEWTQSVADIPPIFADSANQSRAPNHSDLDIIHDQTHIKPSDDRHRYPLYSTQQSVPSVTCKMNVSYHYKSSVTANIESHHGE